MSSDVIAIQTAEAASRSWVETLHEWATTVDHKRLGILYILYALVFLVIAGLEATIIRIQLIRPHNDFVSPQVFNRMFTMHGTTMIFFVVIPVMFGFANYLVPLMIGARDMAFPRLNAFSFWLTALGGFLLYFSFIGGSGLYGAGNAPDVDSSVAQQFASPEQLQHGSIDFRSAIYSLGATMYFLLTGAAPPAKVRLRELRRFPKALRGLLAHMLRGNPDERPQARRHVPVAWVVERKAGERLGPILKNPDQASRRNRMGHGPFVDISQPGTFQIVPGIDSGTSEVAAMPPALP